ncbi:MAG: hypothetical protein KH034_11010 [Lachnospiraceae bacterium]|nr:hypothetical protein [Lachnospiraceae bacterium]
MKRFTEKINPLIIKLRELRHKKWRERIWNIPNHKVIETESAVYIDNKRINNVLTDSIIVEKLGRNSTKVTFSFIAKNFQNIS